MRILLTALLLLAVAAPAAQASKKQFMIFEPARELKSDSREVRSNVLDEIDDFGVKWVRVVLYWREVAPEPDSRSKPSFRESDPSSYDWRSYDRLINEAHSRGLRVWVTPSGPGPDWATLAGDGVDYPSPSRFYRFMKAVGRQFGDRIDRWSIWNEPNHPQFLGPQYRRGRPYSPKLYRRLFKRAHAALNRTGNRGDRVIMGETAPRGNSNVVHPLKFLRRSLFLNRRYKPYRKSKKLPADGFAHHPYTTRSGPFFKSRRKDDVTIGSLGRLIRALNRAGRARKIRKRMPIYLTEFGIQSKPDRHYGVGETRQAEWRSVGERIAYGRGRVKGISQYLMRDDLPREEGDRYGGFESGLRYHDGEKKKSYRSFRLPLVARRDGRRRVRLWGLVRPADGRTRVRIHYRNRGGKRWRKLKRDRTNGRGYWKTTTRYRRGRSYRVVWRDPENHRYKGPRTRVIRWR